MKKQFFIMALAGFLLAPFLMIAQTNRGTIFSVQTRYLIMPLDSTERAALMTLLNDYHSKVTMKNEFVKSERTMWHYWTTDNRELVTITEFADWNAIEKAGDRDMELEKAAWPDQRQRSDFMKKMNGYFSHHSDALYSNMPTLTK